MFSDDDVQICPLALEAFLEMLDGASLLSLLLFSTLFSSVLPFGF
jgi:hypothetical protein